MNPSEDTFTQVTETLLSCYAMQNYHSIQVRAAKLKEIQAFLQLKMENKEDPILHQTFERELNQAMADLNSMKPLYLPNLHAEEAIQVGPPSLPGTRGNGSMSTPPASSSATSILVLQAQFSVALDLQAKFLMASLIFC